MKELLEKWKEWKEAPKVCSCVFPKTEYPVVVMHHRGCPVISYLDTDVGAFLDSLMI
jgi:hypothetical protein